MFFATSLIVARVGLFIADVPGVRDNTLAGKSTLASCLMPKEYHDKGISARDYNVCTE